MTNVDGIVNITLAEIQICETLKNHPHPNVAQYLGCIEKDNKIHGICFVKYKITLADHLAKGYPIDVDHCMAGLEKAVSHLHSLKLVHNDIKPSNIMFDDNNEPILIDFDSCQYDGQALLKGGTSQWADWTIGTAYFASDIDGLRRIREYLEVYNSCGLAEAISKCNDPLFS
ncbi:kinase-like domain-containing protein [Xylaria arbuscula]|nr:kinase-like domain-containing protein [Xylaria arbuscula]